MTYTGENPVTRGLGDSGRGKGGGFLLHFQDRWLTCITSITGQTSFTLLLWACSPSGIGANCLPDVYCFGVSHHLGVFECYTEKQGSSALWVMGVQIGFQVTESPDHYSLARGLPGAGGETIGKGLPLGAEHSWCQAPSCAWEIMVMCLARQRIYHATLTLEIIFLLNQGFLGAFQWIRVERG